jgi:hypothetical protein
MHQQPNQLYHPHGPKPMQASNENRKWNAIESSIPSWQLTATGMPYQNYNSAMPIFVDNNLSTQQTPFYGNSKVFYLRTILMNFFFFLFF